MIDFVGTPQSVRIALCIAMEIMHFHIAQTCFFSHSWCPTKQFGMHLKVPRSDG